MKFRKIAFAAVILSIFLLSYTYWYILEYYFGVLEVWAEQSDPLSLIISLIALLVSITALIYTIRTYWLKAGEKIRFSYTTSSHRNCEDNFIHSITLENLKDKPIVIFGIYLKIGTNNYLKVEEFKEAPLIIKPFEVYQKKFDPLLFYTINLDRMKIDHLLTNRNIKKTLVLSTTNGKYEVDEGIDKWYLVSDLFKNPFTAIISPYRLFYKDQSYGKNVKFLVLLTQKNGEEQVIPVRSDNYKIKVFKGFDLTKESLNSKESLEKFIQKQKEEKNISYEHFEIKEFYKKVENNDILKNGDVIKATNLNKFYYHIWGRLYSMYRDYKLKKKNNE
jgi:hypothetical protein